MIWAAAKALLFAAWSLILGYFVVSLAESMSPPVLFVAPGGFAVAVFAVALLIFPCLWMGFSKVTEEAQSPTEPPRKYRTLHEGPVVTCPICYQPMLLGAVASGSGQRARSLYYCESRLPGHVFWRERDRSAPARPSPWHPCSSIQEGLRAIDL